MLTLNIKVMGIDPKIVEQIRQKRNKDVYGRVKIKTDFPELTMAEIRNAIFLASDTPPDSKIQHYIPKVEKMKKGITVSELRLKHDNKFIIKTNAKKLEKDMFLTDSEFRTSCNFTGGYKDAIEHSDFSIYKGKAGGTIYWSHPESISRMKNEGVLKDV